MPPRSLVTSILNNIGQRGVTSTQNGRLIEVDRRISISWIFKWQVLVPAFAVLLFVLVPFIGGDYTNRDIVNDVYAMETEAAEIDLRLLEEELAFEEELMLLELDLMLAEI